MTTAAHQPPHPPPGGPAPLLRLRLLGNDEPGTDARPPADRTGQRRNPGGDDVGPCYLTITDDGRGGVLVRGRGSATDGAVLRAALGSLADPAVDPWTADPGPRTWAALVRLARRTLGSTPLDLG